MNQDERHDQPPSMQRTRNVTLLPKSSTAKAWRKPYLELLVVDENREQILARPRNHHGLRYPGEIYRARDTRLDHTVAIKVLPAQFAADPQFRDRFDREARPVAAWNHPHICTLYDIGSQGGTDFLVMEYLEGETLAARLEKGALPLDQAPTIAIQIASAQDAAHRQRITHRDLKPSNVRLTKSGTKLLDFGLAKASGPVVAGSSLSMLPTTPPMTAQGTILGNLTVPHRQVSL